MKKSICLILTLILAMSLPLTAFANQTPTKEEIVYLILNGDGSAKNAYVVNAFENTQGSFTDFGDYETIRNLSTEEQLGFENGIVTATSPSSQDKFYYEGKLNNPVIPWDIAISYSLDGSNISADELAGKNGHLEIGLKISQNTSGDKDFYENYALQISTTLDGSRCSNIKAENATIASVGQNKSLSFTLLPKRTADYTISADVKDFEMGPISINGVIFNMSVNTESMDINLGDAFEPLTTGVTELNDGVLKLKNGAKELQDGMDKLNGQSSALVNGSKEVKSAIEQVNSALAAIDNLVSGATQLQAASGNFKSGLNQAVGAINEIAKDTDEVNKLVEMMAQSDNQAAKQLATLYKTKMTALSQTALGLNKLSENYNQIDAGISQFQQNAAKLSGLKSAVGTLLKQYEKFNEGIVAYTNGYGEIASGYASVYNGISELLSATSVMRDKTKDLDKELQEKIDETLSNFGSQSFIPRSFVSEKNENVSNVQFVMRTNAIEIPEIPVVATEVKKLSFFEKLANLFKK